MIERLKRLFSKTPDSLPQGALPVVWLLGKTGAGKSSLVRALTEQTAAEIGDGFRPCTRTATSYDFPPEAPLLRFLDTRGLGEAGYDAEDDLAACRGRSHVVLVVCRLDDPVQGGVADAVADVARYEPDIRAILILTGADLVSDADARMRARRMIETMMNRAARRTLPSVLLALPSDGTAQEGLGDLRAILLDTLPSAGLLLARSEAATKEEAKFQSVRRRVLFYAGLAGTTDVAPIVGAISVPATQLAMLRELGQRYGVTWDRSISAAFLGALGLGAGARFAASYGLRQLAKLIPVYGQTIGAAASGSVSFATTYALGRAAAYFLHARLAGRTPKEAELREVYSRAFKLSSHETE